jgi:hypothetical protein
MSVKWEDLIKEETSYLFYNSWARLDIYNGDLTFYVNNNIKTAIKESNLRNLDKNKFYKIIVIVYKNIIKLEILDTWLFNTINIDNEFKIEWEVSIWWKKGNMQFNWIIDYFKIYKKIN